MNPDHTHENRKSPFVAARAARQNMVDVHFFKGMAQACAKNALQFGSAVLVRLFHGAIVLPPESWATGFRRGASRPFPGPPGGRVRSGDG